LNGHQNPNCGSETGEDDRLKVQRSEIAPVVNVLVESDIRRITGGKFVTALFTSVVPLKYTFAFPLIADGCASTLGHAESSKPTNSHPLGGVVDNALVLAGVVTRSSVNPV
jgi:hypothetical protein